MDLLTLYSRRGCHLCDELLEDLEAACGRGIDLEIVDVDSDPALAERYGGRVPVLAGGGAEICEGRLDRAALESFLRAIAGNGAGAPHAGLRERRRVHRPE